MRVVFGTPHDGHLASNRCVWLLACKNDLWKSRLTASDNLASNIAHRRNLCMRIAISVTAVSGTGTLSRSIDAYSGHLFGRVPQFPLAPAPFRAAATTLQGLDSWRRRLAGRTDYAVCAGRRTRTFPLRASTCARPGVERGLV